MEQAMPAALHQHRIESNTQQPGFVGKMLAAFCARCINRFQSLVECILGQILALFPIAGQAIDCMEDQLAVFRNEYFYRLRGWQCVHDLLFSSSRIYEIALPITKM